MQPDLPYRDRSAAGRFLAEELAHYKSKPDVVVLGLTRGGVPVAAEVASALHAPLDVVVVRKLGVPFQPELAMGAIAGDDTQVLNKQLVHALDLTCRDVEVAITRERLELQRPLSGWTPGAGAERPHGDPDRRRAGHGIDYAGRGCLRQKAASKTDSDGGSGGVGRCSRKVA